jgi:hypothetical protein
LFQDLGRFSISPPAIFFRANSGHGFPPRCARLQPAPFASFLDLSPQLSGFLGLPVFCLFGVLPDPLCRELLLPN